MKESKIKIVPATYEHAIEFYGSVPKSFKGFAGLLNGKVVGMCGLGYEKRTVSAFSDIKEEARPYKKDICRGIRLFNKMIKKTRHPIAAIADKKEKNSERILRALGFTQNGQTTSHGKIFWRIP